MSLLSFGVFIALVVTRVAREKEKNSSHDGKKS